jgi:hypothetical protein
MLFNAGCKTNKKTTFIISGIYRNIPYSCIGPLPYIQYMEDSISGVGSPKDSSTFPLRFRSTSGPASGGPRLRVPAHVETTSGH